MLRRDFRIAICPLAVLLVVSVSVPCLLPGVTAAAARAGILEDAGVRAVTTADGSILIDVIPKQVVVEENGCPVVRSSFEMPAPDAPSRGEDRPSRDGFTWTMQLQTSAVFTDLSMAGPTHGFASAELGKVYRTTDGATWTLVLNLGFPRYWYGVHAFDGLTAFVTGFQNQTGEGIARWTDDGGASWTDDIVIDPDDWLTINQFADVLDGITTNIGGGMTHVTVNGGAGADDWSDVLADPSGGWFSGNFTFMPENLFVYLTGISFCRSRDGGLSYFCRSSIDPVFDGGVSFPDTTHGWTGGGQISAPVQGWVHRTTDAGVSWSGRVLNPPYPIRSLLFFNDSVGFAVGGNYFQAIGGIWSTTDGGDTWNLDVDTGMEMKGIDWARVSPDSVDVWCAGSATPGTGRVYWARIHLPGEMTDVRAHASSPEATRLTVCPNPFNPHVTIRFEAARDTRTRLVILDAGGRHVRRLVDRDGLEGAQEVVWDGYDDRGRSVASGVYLAVLTGSGRAPAHRLVLLR